jgi:perosamine synthetase
MDAVNEVASKHSLWVVEDAAEAHFAGYKDRTVGALADVATFSFYGNKIMTCGEGGAVVFSDERMKQRLQMLRGQGMDPQRRYFFPIVGYNYRLTNVAAALLCAQLERIDDIQSRRNQIYDWYNNELKDIPEIKLQPSSSWATVAPWLYCITIADDDRSIDANHLSAALAEKGIDTRPFFIPVHSMPPYEQTYQTRRSRMTVTDQVSRLGLNIPTYLGMTRDDVIYISQSIREIFRSQG